MIIYRAVDAAPNLILLEVVQRGGPWFAIPQEVELQHHSLESGQVFQMADDPSGIV